LVQDGRGGQVLVSKGSLMTWNHRVIRILDTDGTYYYAIHECFYTSKRSKLPHSWTADAVSVGSDTTDGLLWVLQKMKEAVAKPALEIHGDKLREI